MHSCQQLIGGDGVRVGAEMIQLPMDVMNRVFQFLDAPSLASASCVSSDWHSYAKDDMLWESHVRFTFFRGEERSVRKEEASRWEEFRALQGGVHL